MAKIKYDNEYIFNLNSTTTKIKQFINLFAGPFGDFFTIDGLSFDIDPFAFRSFALA